MTHVLLLDVLSVACLVVGYGYLAYLFGPSLRCRWRGYHVWAWFHPWRCLGHDERVVPMYIDGNHWILPVVQRCVCCSQLAPESPVEPSTAGPFRTPTPPEASK